METALRTCFPGFVNFIWKDEKRQNDMLFILPYFINISLKNIVEINEVYLQNREIV